MSLLEYIVRTHDLTKAFDGVEVVSRVNLKIRKGEIYGLLGPNGAGKTTIIKLLTNLLKPTSGSIEIFNEVLTNDSYEINKRIGNIIEYPAFYEKLSGSVNLEIHCEYMGYYNKKDIDEALKLVGLSKNDKKPVKNYSMGMKQRLGIARAIVTKPELLILDEPINGLDPEGIKELRDILKMLSTEYHMTIIISSHILSEIEQLADTVGVLVEGRLVEETSIDELNRHNVQFVEIKCSDNKKALCVLDEMLSREKYKMYEGKIRIYTDEINLQEVIKKLMESNINLLSIENKTRSLEDHFMKVIKEERKHA